MKRRRLLRSSVAQSGVLSTTPLAAGAAHAAAPGRGRGHSGEVLRVHLVTLEGVEEPDVCGPLEVFAVAARAHPVMVQPVTGGEAAEVIHSLGMKGAAAAWSPHDVAPVVVPGGGFGRRDRRPRRPGGDRHLAEQGARVADQRVVVDGDLVPAGPHSLAPSAELRRIE